MKVTEFTFTAKPDRQGRISIPIAVREALGMKDDEAVLLEIRVKRIV